MSQENEKKRPLPFVLVLLILVIGIGMILYPIVSNLLYEKDRSLITTEYEQQAEKVETNEKEALLAEARQYNESLLKANIVLTDPFDPSVLEKQGTDPYMSLLNYAKDGIMGYVSIPVIDVELPIYHGTSSDVLEKGIGHLEQTSLPVGGTGTHCVLTGHTGLAGKRMLTDLPELIEGDVFYLHVFHEILAYKVVNIAVVEPNDTKLLYIDRTADKATLLTCYPYGVNSHRLLVTGERLEYEEALAQEQAMSRTTEDIWQKQYVKGILLCLVIYIPLLIAGMWFIRKKRKSE